MALVMYMLAEAKHEVLEGLRQAAQTIAVKSDQGVDRMIMRVETGVMQHRTWLPIWLPFPDQAACP